MGNMTIGEYRQAFPIWERAVMHEEWKRGLYALAKGNDCATVRDRNTYCPCIVFERDGYRAVCYLHSDECMPAMYLGKEYMSFDYRLMLDVLKGHFGN